MPLAAGFTDRPGAVTDQLASPKDETLLPQEPVQKLPLAAKATDDDAVLPEVLV